MIVMKQPIAGREAFIRITEDARDVNEFLNWLDARKGKTLAVDTETTGLNIFEPGFKIRTIQVGHGLESWVIPVEEVQINPGFLLDYDLVFHNAAYDVLALRRVYGLKLDWSRITDTYILGHISDPREKKEGGVGNSLQDLTDRYLDPVVAEEIKGSMNRLCRESGLKKDDVWREISVWNETYLRYAGMDPVLTYGLWNVLSMSVPEVSQAKGLVRREHEIARVCAEMEWNGLLLDTEYAQALSSELREEEEVWEAIALVEYGTESVNANAQIAADLIESGVRLTELTASGAYKLDKDIIDPLAEEGHLLAQAVVQAKRAKKWRESWVDKFLSQRSGIDRCHAKINPLRARTARMSITGIPAQTLPANDWIVRRCFIPEPGFSMVSCDYQAQELRVLAALSGDENMREAFRTGADLHQMTADASGVHRDVGKTVNFAYVYGSGPANIAKATGISVQKAREVIQGFERTYPGVKKYSDYLMRQAKSQGYVETATGRRLPVDSDRPYAALNYMIQSTSRDITAAALLRLDDAGFTPYLRLPIHDEILACVPEDQAESGAERIAEIMACDFNGVHIAADADVLGRSWGEGYLFDDDPKIEQEKREAYERTF